LGVPPSILTNEMLPILWRDPSYLDRKGFTVVNKPCKRVQSSEINGRHMAPAHRFRSCSPREKTMRWARSNSSSPIATPFTCMTHHPGSCFRGQSGPSVMAAFVSGSRRFAEIVLGYSADAVAKKIRSGQSQSVSLKEKIPVHLTYFTAWPGDDGRIEYFADVYGRDIPIENAFGLKRVALR
jgi:murein L,D-transpeptidase YcbB/YkuD